MRGLRSIGCAALVALATSAVGCRRERAEGLVLPRTIHAAEVTVARRDAPRLDPIVDSVVLVTIDGVRSRDLFAGAGVAPPFAVMPRMKALIDDGGVVLGGGGDGCGKVEPANSAYVSLPGYFEILSGRSTDCMSNACARIATQTILDDIARDSEARGLGPAASIASWPGIARAATAGDSPVLVSAGRTWPARPADDTALEAALAAVDHDDDPSPGSGNYRRDEETIRVALAYLRSARPRLLHVGLGDSDEYGHDDDYRAYVGALRRADRAIAEIASTLGDLGLRREVIVTTDHGRGADFRDHGSAYPGSERSFVAAFGDGVEARGVVCHHGDVFLPDVDATIRAIAGLAPDDDPRAGQPIAELLPAGESGS